MSEEVFFLCVDLCEKNYPKLAKIDKNRKKCDKLKFNNFNKLL